MSNFFKSIRIRFFRIKIRVFIEVWIRSILTRIRDPDYSCLVAGRRGGGAERTPSTAALLQGAEVVVQKGRLV